MNVKLLEKIFAVITALIKILAMNVNVNRGMSWQKMERRVLMLTNVNNLEYVVKSVRIRKDHLSALVIKDTLWELIKGHVQLEVNFLLHYS